MFTTWIFLSLCAAAPTQCTLDRKRKRGAFSPLHVIKCTLSLSVRCNDERRAYERVVVVNACHGERATMTVSFFCHFACSRWRDSLVKERTKKATTLSLSFRHGRNLLKDQLLGNREAETWSGQQSTSHSKRKLAEQMDGKCGAQLYLTIDQWAKRRNISVI